MKLTDNPEGDLSEEEADDASEQNEDTRSQFSEIPENQSAVISVGTIGRVPAMKDKVKKRLEKAWHAAKELVDSEQRYVDKLRLLDEVYFVAFGHIIKKANLRMNEQSVMHF